MLEKQTLISKNIRFLTITMLIIWLILPLIPLVIWSFARGWFYPHIFPKQWTLSAWQYALSDTSGILESLYLTMLISTMVTFIAVLVGVPAGRALGLYKFKGKEIIKVLILAPIIVPGIAVVLGIHSIFLSLGLNNTIYGVILVHLIPTLPYMILVMSSVFSNFDKDYEAQARSLGASSVKTFWYITFPTILPGIVVGGLFVFLVSWSQYILTFLIGGGRILTLPLILFNFASAGRNDVTGAIAMIYILPGIVILLFTARFLSGRSIAKDLGQL